MVSMNRAFAIGISLCISFFGFAFLATGYQTWLSTVMAAGAMFFWVGGLALLRAWRAELGSVTSVLALLLHLALVLCSASGLVFILPEASVESEWLPWFGGASVLSMLLPVLLFLGYARQKTDVLVLPYLRHVMWANASVILLITLMLWSSFFWDAEISLLLFFLQLVFSLEGLFRTIRVIRAQWKGMKFSSDTLLDGVCLNVLNSRANPVSSMFESSGRVLRNRYQRYLGDSISQNGSRAVSCLCPSPGLDHLLARPCGDS